MKPLDRVSPDTCPDSPSLFRPALHPSTTYARALYEDDTASVQNDLKLAAVAVVPSFTSCALIKAIHRFSYHTLRICTDQIYHNFFFGLGTDPDQFRITISDLVLIRARVCYRYQVLVCIGYCIIGLRRIRRLPSVDSSSVRAEF